jgi:hypothetical protein
MPAAARKMTNHPLLLPPGSILRGAIFFVLGVSIILFFLRDLAIGATYL